MDGYAKRLAAATHTEEPLRRIRDAGRVLARGNEQSDREEPSILDYGVRPISRWGYGKPSHPKLTALIEQGRGGYTDLLKSFLGFHDRFAQIPVTAGPADGPVPTWRNDMIAGLDTIALYSILALEQPALYLEIGSGNSTRFARRSIRDNGLVTKIISIDPHPRAECDELCDEIVREPFEDVDLGLFDRVGPGDVVFLDGSHRCFTNSDATAFFMDVMPRLPRGAMVHIHDIFLPDDYPPVWAERFYSEQYLLGSWLLGGGSGYEVMLPNNFVSHDAQLHEILDPIWDDPRFSGMEDHGCSFWLKRFDG